MQEQTFNSDYLTGGSKERFKELEEKGHDWRSFYSGWIEGRVKMWEDYRKGYSLQQISDAWDAALKWGMNLTGVHPKKDEYLSPLTPTPDVEEVAVAFGEWFKYSKHIHQSGEFYMHDEGVYTASELFIFWRDNIYPGVIGQSKK